MQVWAKFRIEDKNTPLYKYVLPGLKGRGYAYGPRLPSQMRSLISRYTCNLPVFWIPNVDLKSEQTTGGKGHIRHKADAYFGSLGSLSSLGSVVTRRVVHVYFLF